jgi:uncharacterized oxidoreductase
MLDHQGQPTTDPRFAVIPPFGALLPFGEHKGYGLALMAELLGAALTGSESQAAPLSRPRGINGMLCVLIDPEAMDTAESFSAQTQAFTQWVLQSPPSGDGPVRLPGDPERQKKQLRLKEGIPLDATTWQELLDAAEKLGLPAKAVAEAAGL